MSSVYTRRTSSSIRSVSTISARGTTGVRASTSLIAILLGLALRLLLFLILPRSPKVTYTLIGLWEGPVLHHFVSSSSPDNFDPYVGFGVRLFVDFLATEGDYRRQILVCLWTGTGLVLADVAPDLWKSTGAKRFWHHLRRQLYILGSRMRRWSPVRMWKIKTPSAPRRPTTIRFDDFPTRHTPSRTPAAAADAPANVRDNASTLSGSAYSTSDSVSTFTPPSILSVGSSKYTRSFAPSVVSNVQTNPPSSSPSLPRPIDVTSEDSDSDADTDTATPPASIDYRLRKQTPVPAVPGFFPDHFSETGTDFSVLPPRGKPASAPGTSHATFGAIPSRKGKERARQDDDDDDDMYTDSGLTGDHPLTETEEYSSSTPSALHLQEIPDEVLPLPLRPSIKGLELELESNAKEDELEKQRQLDAVIEPPPTATMPVIPDEPRPQLDDLHSHAGTAEAASAPVLDSEWTSINKGELPPPPPPKDATPEEPSAAEPSSQEPPAQPPSPPSLQHKRSFSSLVSGAPDFTVVPPSENGETDSMWGVSPPPEGVVAETIPEEPTNATPDHDAPEPPPRENPYINTVPDADASRHTPPPSFQEAINSPVLEEVRAEETRAGEPLIDLFSPAADEPVAGGVAQEEPTEEPQAAPSSEIVEDPLILETSPTPPPSPPTTAIGRLSYIVELTESQHQLLKDLHGLERQRQAALEEGAPGVAVAIARRDEMRKVQKKLERIGEEVFLAHNPWIATGEIPPEGKSFDLSGMDSAACIEKLEEMLATLIRDNAESRRKSVVALNFEGELDPSFGVTTLDKMPNTQLLIQLDKQAKHRNPKKEAIYQLCKEQKLRYVTKPGSLGRQITIMLPSLEDETPNDY